MKFSFRKRKLLVESLRSFCGWKINWAFRMNRILVFCISFLAVSIYPSEIISRIPLRSFPFLSYQKFVEIEIDGHPYLSLVDTGSAFSMIRKDVLNEITNKSYVCDSEYVGIKGDKYLTPNFQIPEVKIGDFCTESVFKEEDEKFWTDGCTIDGYSFINSVKIYLMYQVYREAVIGRDLFRKFACVFDFPHSCIFIADNMDHLIGNADEFCVVPFEMGTAGVVLSVETDLGENSFLLDSAATRSFINFSAVCERCQGSETFFSKRLRVGSNDFGGWKFRKMKIASEFGDIDGILGIDFFNRNLIGLDFECKLAYIHSPKIGSKERFTYWIKSCFGK